ncbi:uncharacterized protein [Hoplias malabaricus]|uniref:uncharacterized protein n=1 Tax=Hoplias malabaricus TaxID=27720 RepID=UPI0034624625
MIFLWTIVILLSDWVLSHVMNATFLTVRPGENATLECYMPFKRVTTMVWYKQSIGQIPRPVTLMYNYIKDVKFQDEFKDGRFNVSLKSGSFHLSITAVTSQDIGTYYCGIIFLNQLEFLSWTVLMPTDATVRSILQPPVSELVLEGDSVTLQCTFFTQSCSDEHSVYWFRHGSGESPPGIIYTHGDTNSPCSRSSETDSPTQSCVYKLPKTNLSLSDVGTYYCAVAVCGQILFGNGTKLTLIENGSGNVWDPVTLGFVCTNIFSVVVIIALVFDQHSNCRKKHKVATNEVPVQTHQTVGTAEMCSDDVNYSVVSFTENSSKSSKTRTTRSKDFSMYAEVSSSQEH